MLELLIVIPALAFFAAAFVLIEVIRKVRSWFGPRD